jgi:dimethylaniline monooxygenase (N-oxide forming)
MVEVAVIGAGAAGLVASRHLLRVGLRPTILEQRSSVGGAWAGGSNMWDSLTTNLSKHTCCFSDFDHDPEIDLFPSRRDVQTYLERYAQEYIEPECFRYDSTVTKISSLDEKFRVEWTDGDQLSCSHEFDKVLVATGFFASPVLPYNTSPIVQHSSEYKSPKDYIGQRVAVVGGAFSALEIAASVCKQADRVVSIMPSVPWVLPRMIPDAEGRFLPVDLFLYRRSSKAPTIEQQLLNDDAIRERHAFLKKLVGQRKQSVLGIPDESSVPVVAVSDDYLDCVSSGKIQVVHGRLDRVDGKRCVVNGEVLEEEFDTIISCTGYRTNLDHLLSKEIQNLLEYDPEDGFAPLTLAHDCLHPQLSNMGFVGMYRGPYMGIMELQARLLAGLWSGQVQPSQKRLTQALEQSQQRRSHQPRAQFPHFDYIGTCDGLAELLDLVPPSPFGDKGSMITPTFYQPSIERSTKALEDLTNQVQKGNDITPNIVLSALIGKWSFQRTIRHFNTDVEQNVSGTIHYSLHGPQLDTVLYREDGVFRLPNGREMDVFREYEYTENHGALEIYFIEDGKRADLFLGLKFQNKMQEYWEATSDHLCIKDLYKGTFQVTMDGIAASKVTITYRVNGPSKDYESVTHLYPA